MMFLVYLCMYLCIHKISFLLSMLFISMYFKWEHATRTQTLGKGKGVKRYVLCVCKNERIVILCP